MVDDRTAGVGENDPKALRVSFKDEFNELVSDTGKLPFMWGCRVDNNVSGVSVLEFLPIYCGSFLAVACAAIVSTSAPFLLGTFCCFNCWGDMQCCSRVLNFLSERFSFWLELVSVGSLWNKAHLKKVRLTTCNFGRICSLTCLWIIVWLTLADAIKWIMITQMADLCFLVEVIIQSASPCDGCHGWRSKPFFFLCLEQANIPLASCCRSTVHSVEALCDLHR